MDRRLRKVIHSPSVFRVRRGWERRDGEEGKEDIYTLQACRRCEGWRWEMGDGEESKAVYPLVRLCLQCLCCAPISFINQFSIVLV